MKVLVACEESQEVCKAFRERGHEAYSCDVQECSGGHPEWHIKRDVIEIIYPDIVTFNFGYFCTQDGAMHKLPIHWDLIIAHPPCTYLSNAGARWLYAGGKINSNRYMEGWKGRAFFMAMLDAPCDKIAVENPIPSKVFHLPPYTQVIQPYEYGHPYSKKTCLWLKGLPALQPTEIIAEHIPYVFSGSYNKSHDPKYKGASRKGGSAKMRAKTFSGIARAMAEQWGSEALAEYDRESK